MKKLLYLLLLAALWGPSFLFIRLAVHDIPPVTMVAGRMVLATLALYALMKIRGVALPRGRAVYAKLAFVGFIGTALPFVLVGWGEQHIDSALASILNATVPLFTLVIAHFTTEDDRLDVRKVVGIGLGLLGALALIVPSVEGGIRAGTLGLLAVTMSAVCYAISGVYARKHLRGLPPLAAPTIQFAFCAVYLVPLSLIIDRPWTLDNPSSTAWIAFAGLVGLGTVAAFAVYYHLIEFATASYVSMVTYLIPVIAVVLGVTVANEHLDWTAYLGCGLILMGVLAVNRRSP